MYEQFVHDPNSVSDSWQEFFADYRSQTPSLAAAAAASTRVREIAADHGARRRRPHRRSPAARTPLDRAAAAGAAAAGR